MSSNNKSMKNFMNNNLKYEFKIDLKKDLKNDLKNKDTEKNFFSPDIHTRLFAIRRLPQIDLDQPALVEKLANLALDSSDPRITEAFLKILPELSSLDPVWKHKRLLEMLQKEPVGVKIQALKVLEGLENPSYLAVKSLLALEKNPQVLASLIPLLKKFSADEAWPLMYPLLSHEESRVRANLLEVITYFKTLGPLSKDMEQKLLVLLKDSNSRIRANAMVSLFPEFLPEILREVKMILKTGSSGQRASVCFAIGSMPHEELLLLLLKATKDVNIKVASIALNSLGKIANSNVIPHLLEGVSAEKNSQMRNLYTQTAAHLDKEITFSHLKELFLVEGDPRHRANLVMAFSPLVEEPGLTPFLLPFLKDKNPRVRANIIDIFELSLRDKNNPEKGDLPSRLRESLIHSLSDANNRVRANACRVLWKTGIHLVISTLKHMLVQADFKMRASAAHALGELESLQFFDLIQDALVDVHPEVRKTAQAALAKLQKKSAKGSLPLAV